VTNDRAPDHGQMDQVYSAMDDAGGYVALAAKIANEEPDLA